MFTQKFPTVFQSVEYVKVYLQNHYKRQRISDYKELAYQNCYTFVYYVKLGETYFQQGTTAPLSIKPVLFFYGLCHWLKACILIKDPNYPATTQVLAHGVSTRKKKKRDYRFLSDEVKVQKEGFFPFLSEQLFHFKQLTGEKYKMGQLLKTVPELIPLFKELKHEEPLFPISKGNNGYIVGNELMEKLQLTPEKFELMVKEKLGTVISCTFLDNNIHVKIKTKKEAFPIYQSLQQQMYLPTQLPLYWRLPEILAHFLLLYNLSMICRYEAEWWGELLYSFSTNDRTFIQTFLQCTETKVPYLINQMLP